MGIKRWETWTSLWQLVYSYRIEFKAAQRVLPLIDIKVRKLEDLRYLETRCVHQTCHSHHTIIGRRICYGWFHRTPSSLSPYFWSNETECTLRERCERIWCNFKPDLHTPILSAGSESSNFKQNPSKKRAKICKQLTDFSKCSIIVRTRNWVKMNPVFFYLSSVTTECIVGVLGIC